MPPAKVEPGRDPEMSARTKTLNVVFALTSIGLLIAFSLMVWADYDRPWKKYQIEFNELEVKLTKEQRDAALGKVDAAKAKALEAQLAEGEKQIAAQAGELAKFRAEVERLKGVWYRVDQDFRFTKAKIDVARYDYEEALHKGEKSAVAKKKRLDDLEASVAPVSGSTRRRSRPIRPRRTPSSRPSRARPRARRRPRPSFTPRRRASTCASRPSTRAGSPTSATCPSSTC